MIAPANRILWLPTSEYEERDWDYESGGYGASRNPSGVRVDADTALRCTVVLACVRVLATSVAGLPLHIECKNTQNVRLREWVLQCRRDSRGAWVLCYHLPRSPGLPNGEWLGIQPLATWADDSRAFQEAREHKDARIKAIVEEAARTGF